MSKCHECYAPYTAAFILSFYVHNFYAPQLVPPGTAEARISYGHSVRISVCLSVCHDPVVYQAQVR